MPDPTLDTATQRPATGLDRGARELILRVVHEDAGLAAVGVVDRFFRDQYGGYDDYFDALESVWGEDMMAPVRDVVYTAHGRAASEGSFGNFDADPDRAAADALLHAMPEPDFRAAVTEAVRTLRQPEEPAARIDRICSARGGPWTFSYQDGFEFVGDEEVERELILPALAAINRQEFAGGVRSEFESARAELSTGTPQALKQAVHEAGCAVESAMKVVLDEHGVQRDPRDAARRLFDRLEGAGIVPRHMEYLVLVVMTPRNRLGGHGAGASPHSVDPEEAATVVAGAAGAIAYLATRLP